MKLFSPRNLAYMRAFAAAWPDEQILQQAVVQLPWGHITVLLDRLDDHELRDWYAGQASANGWSRNLLEHQIRSEAYTRLRAEPTNSAEVLPPADSDLAQQITKDPYVLNFLALALGGDADAVVRYSLAGQQSPIGVASYDLLPPAVRAALPSEADLAAALATETDILEP